MGENTKIEWADDTFNAWVGCERVSPACANCYAEGWARRSGQGDLWHGVRRRTSAANWRKPRAWNTDAAMKGRRRVVFVNSLSDVFEAHVDLDAIRSDLFELVEQTPALTYLLLTKRPENIARMIPARWHDSFPANVWTGTTVEDQRRADIRIPELVRAPGPHFLSMEPLLGPVVLPPGVLGECRCNVEAEDGAGMHDGRCPATRPRPISWVIAGGESGGKARPSSPDWYRMIRDRCTDAGVPFLFKQWGEWAPLPPEGVAKPSTVRTVGGRSMERVGKAAAGRLLDGVKYDGVPW